MFMYAELAHLQVEYVAETRRLADKTRLDTDDMLERLSRAEGDVTHLTEKITEAEASGHEAHQVLVVPVCDDSLQCRRNKLELNASSLYHCITMNDKRNMTGLAAH